MKTTFIGIDISSATVDIFVKHAEGKTQALQLKNRFSELSRFFKAFDEQSVVVAMENTGRYNWALYRVLAELQCSTYVINPLNLKRSIGLVRGKNDKIDAVRICQFIEKNHLEHKQWKPCAESIQRLKILLSERKNYIKCKNAATRKLQDYRLMEHLDMEAYQQRASRDIVYAKQQIAEIEKQIECLIKKDEKLKEQQRLMQTVPGVGKVLCWFILAKTEGFTLVNQARKLSCYTGVVPFEHQSGTSVRGKTRTSQYADKTLKCILHLGAMSAIRLNNDLRVYYLRKVAEGKNKMSVLNAVRNKIIHRVFAVIHNQKEYSKSLLVS